MCETSKFCTSEIPRIWFHVKLYFQNCSWKEGLYLEHCRRLFDSSFCDHQNYKNESQNCNLLCRSSLCLISSNFKLPSWNSFVMCTFASSAKKGHKKATSRSGNFTIFSVAKILREIIFEEFKRSKNATFANLEALDFVNLLKSSLQNCKKKKKIIKIKLQSLSMC